MLWFLTWGRGQCCRAYHSWQYRLTWMPWPRNSMVHISTFHAGPVCRSCIMKFIGPEAGEKIVTPMPDTHASHPWLLSIPGHWEERDQEGPIGKDLEPSSRNPWRSEVTHGKPGFLSLPSSNLDLMLNLPTSTSFLPFVSLCVCPAQMLLWSQKSSPTSPRTPPCCH